MFNQFDILTAENPEHRLAQITSEEAPGFDQWLAESQAKVPDPQPVDLGDDLDFSPSEARQQKHTEQMGLLASIRADIAPALERLNFFDTWCV